MIRKNKFPSSKNNFFKNVKKLDIFSKYLFNDFVEIPHLYSSLELLKNIYTSWLALSEDEKSFPLFNRESITCS